MDMTDTLDLSLGSALVLDGREWVVERREPHTGHVHLVDGGGARQSVTFRFLSHHPSCRPSSRTGAQGAGRGRQAKSVKDLTPNRLQLVELRYAHLMEVERGYRSGSPLRPGPGEPRPQYDPDTTTVTARREAKAAELAAMDRQKARALALDRVGVRTLIRWQARSRAEGMIGCADDRWLRKSGGHPSAGEEVREAIHAVRAETLHGAKVSMRTRERKIHQYVREQFGEEIEVPSYWVLCRIWHEWFGTGRQRQRYARSAQLPEKGGYVLVDRPGQVVALDTTVLPVMVRESVFDEPVKVHLSLALDTYTHSICAFRLTLVSDTAVDIAMLLRDVMVPLPMRADWGEEMAWPYPGLPAAIVAEFAGYEVAGLPFFAPETVTTDHGSVYRNHRLVQAERVLGCNVLPARVLRPTDKQAVERVFGSIRSLLFEQLPGYTGVDVADQGADPQGDALLTISGLEKVIARWIVETWQRRRLGEYAPHWDPGGDHSPNSLLAAAFEQGGFAMQIPRPELYYQLLPETAVQKIDPRRGVKVRGLWYDGPALGPYRGAGSSRGGARKNQWILHRDPRDRRTVSFQDPLTHDWHPLEWTGLPPVGTVPAFGDKRATELLQRAERAGLRPRTDTELLPHLLELMRLTNPVDRWPSRLTRAEKVELARERLAGEAAAADRPISAPWPAGQDTTIEAPVTLEEERVVIEPVMPPRRLGDTARRRNLVPGPNPAEAAS